MLLLSVACVAVVVAATIVVVTRSSPPRPPSISRPNILLILTDDQRWDQLSNMPTVESELVRRGVTFANGFVTDPLCCPSRTTILTGKYSHSTGVYHNSPPHGGFKTFTSRHEDRSTIATWLHRAGYDTGLIGKYLNGYGASDASYVPPGWDYWRAQIPGRGEGRAAYYNYSISTGDRVIRYGKAPADYSNTVFTRDALGFLRQVPASKPFFMYYAPRAPHSPFTPPPDAGSQCKGVRPPRPPSYNEADVSDKPSYIRADPPMSPQQDGRIRRSYLDSCKSLLGVDQSVKLLLNALSEDGRLHDTLILYASDNGLLFGEHRWTHKKVPYEESIRVPIVIRYDPLTRGHVHVDHHLVLNLDFAETFADAAGVASRGGEGTSLLPLLVHPNTLWRHQFVVEQWMPHTAAHYVPPYCGLRTARYFYVVYETGEAELYDLRRDPFELQNRVSDPALAPVRRKLHEELVRACEPPPPDMHLS